MELFSGTIQNIFDAGFLVYHPSALTLDIFDGEGTLNAELHLHTRGSEIPIQGEHLQVLTTVMGYFC